jgi:uncharacterized membrane protein YbhN (UPF0104 family)
MLASKGPQPGKQDLEAVTRRVQARARCGRAASQGESHSVPGYEHDRAAVTANISGPGSAAVTTSVPDSDSAAVTTARHLVRRLVGALLLAVALATLLLAVPPLRGVARQIGHMAPGWIVAAVALEIASCLGFVVIFRRFFDLLPAGVGREIAWIETGSGALLPGGGVGALAVGGLLLRRWGVSIRTVVERSSGLFFLTSAVNVAALVGSGALLATGIAAGPHDLIRTGIPIVGGIAAAVVVLLVPVLVRQSPQRRWPAWFGDLTGGIGGAFAEVRRPNWRLLGAAGYLGFDIAALGAAFAATGHAIPFAELILGYLIGYLANLIPVPGGFGVLEGGLAGTLIAYGTSPTQTAAAVVVYHAIAFWIPSIGGVLGFALFRRTIAHAAPIPPLGLDRAVTSSAEAQRAKAVGLTAG